MNPLKNDGRTTIGDTTYIPVVMAQSEKSEKAGRTFMSFLTSKPMKTAAYLVAMAVTAAVIAPLAGLAAAFLGAPTMLAVGVGAVVAGIILLGAAAEATRSVGNSFFKPMEEEDPYIQTRQEAVTGRREEYRATPGTGKKGSVPDSRMPGY